MATLGQPIPISSDSVAFEGGYDPNANVVAAKELDSSKTANGTTYGPQRVVVSGMAGYIAAAASQPASTSAGADTSWAFSQKANHVLLQNGSTSNVPFELDTAATAGSIYLAPGQMILLDIKATAIHFYTASSIAINSSSAGGINIRGWL